MCHGPEGWGPEGWGAQNFPLCFSSPHSALFVSLSLHQQLHKGAGFLRRVASNFQGQNHQACSTAWTHKVGVCGLLLFPSTIESDVVCLMPLAVVGPAPQTPKVVCTANCTPEDGCRQPLVMNIRQPEVQVAHEEVGCDAPTSLHTLAAALSKENLLPKIPEIKLHGGGQRRQGDGHTNSCVWTGATARRGTAEAGP